MVLMRRRDKRKGNSEEELAVASDATIVANKGVRSLRAASPMGEVVLITGFATVDSALAALGETQPRPEA